MHSEKEEKTATNWLKEAQKGYMRIAVLILLSKKPYHGYEIMKEIKNRTGGFWRPTAGGVYPLLKSLEKAGYIEGEWALQKKRRRKTYKITETGRMILDRALAKQSQIANSMSALFEEFVRDVLDVETKSLPMPRMPNPFSGFLEERKEKSEDNVEALEGKRLQIEQMIKTLRSKLQTVDKRLAQLKQPKGKSDAE
ncbi:MAG: PadR family transcriptional regulator [Candidatus Bathyarchaeota archaeon]|jgi:DNA-binding PadR family transcriptional regulator